MRVIDVYNDMNENTRGTKRWLLGPSFSSSQLTCLRANHSRRIRSSHPPRSAPIRDSHGTKPPPTDESQNRPDSMHLATKLHADGEEGPSRNHSDHNTAIRSPAGYLRAMLDPRPRRGR
jgi:hypothetical protein